MIKTDKRGEKHVTILLFCVFQHFDREIKFLLSNCVWNLYFVSFRLIIALKDIALLIFFTKPQLLLFYLFLYPGFPSIFLTILSLFEQSTFSEK